MVGLLDAPLSFYSIPAVYAISWIPARLRVNAILRNNCKFNNVVPRGNLARLEKDESVDRDFVNYIAKLEGAHQNGVEAFPLWSVAVILGSIAGLENKTMNIFSALFVSGRLLYTYLYVYAKTRKQSLARSGVWLLTTGMALYIVVRASIVRSRWTY